MHTTPKPGPSQWLQRKISNRAESYAKSCRCTGCDGLSQPKIGQFRALSSGLKSRTIDVAVSCWRPLAGGSAYPQVALSRLSHRAYGFMWIISSDPSN